MNIEARQPVPEMSAPAESPSVVHVLDDDEAVRRGISLLLQSAGIPAVTHVSGVAFLEALPNLNEADIGCVLTDVRMPGLDGVALLEQLKAVGFSRPVVVMTAHGDVATAVRAMKAGAMDFIEKPFDDEALLATIGRSIAIHDASRSREGHPGAPPEGPIAAHPEVVEAARRMAGLSPREREVLDLLVAGKPNKLIAHELGISQRTAEVHRARLMARLGVRSLAEALRLAIKAELADDTVRSALAAAGEDDGTVAVEAG
jgi:two-component system, LuxR family, response regulator FixJ